tara:strand:- start:957 stop:1490 length:534 start_codon:yes stop_codon:yes gene_type:complete
MIDFKIPPIGREVRKYMDKFGDKAVDEIVKVMKKAGQDEVRNTRNRLFSRSTTSGDIYQKVGSEVTFAINPAGPKQIPILRFGAGDDFQGVIGETGKQNINIAGILAFGKPKGSPQSNKKFAFYKKLGAKIFLPEGYSSPAKEPEPAFLDKAEENLQKKIEEKVPEALRKAFGEVSF